MTVKRSIYRAGIAIARPFIQASRTLYPKKSSPYLLRVLNQHAVISGIVLTDEQAYTLGCCNVNTFFRTASLSKMVTALGVMKLADQYTIPLDACISSFTPLKLQKITLRQLLSHTSGLIDGNAYQSAIKFPVTLNSILDNPSIRQDNHSFCYSNLGFGILGSVIEYVSGESLELWMRKNIFNPLGLNCTYDITTLDKVADSCRILPPHKAFNAAKRKSESRPIVDPEPQNHYSLAAGNLYSDAASIMRVLKLIAHDGEGFFKTETIQAMKTPHAAYGSLSPTLSYGLGLLVINDSVISAQTVYGHQGFAYGCVNGAFLCEKSNRFLVSLNNGASEARYGRLGCLNHDLLKWAMRR